MAAAKLMITCATVVFLWISIQYPTRNPVKKTGILIVKISKYDNGVGEIATDNSNAPIPTAESIIYLFFDLKKLIKKGVKKYKTKIAGTYQSNFLSEFNQKLSVVKFKTASVSDISPLYHSKKQMINTTVR
ncbi:hypothetical protein PUR_31560 [Paenibacillus sp. URB8-2]|nr:hypothetical protein PUR_31560 [Paenibacillus sp. URB8-2]